MSSQNINPTMQDSAETLQKISQPGQATNQPALQLTAESSPAIDQIMTALCKAQSQMTFAPKESEASMGNGRMRKYADLASVIAAVRKPLADNGIAFVQLPVACKDGLRLRTVLGHTSGQWLACEFYTAIESQRTMNSIQALGSAMTYLRRYSLAAICGIAQDDDDGVSAGEIARDSQQQETRNLNKFFKAIVPARIQQEQMKRMLQIRDQYFDGDRVRFASEVTRILRHPVSNAMNMSLADANKVLQELEKNIAEPTDPDVPDVQTNPEDAQYEEAY